MSGNYFLFLAITRLVVLSSVDSDFTIYRGDTRRGTDRFTMTPSFCAETAGNGDVCGQFYAVNNSNGRRCDCLCPYHRSTFIYHNFRWMCLPNDILRCRQGCKYLFKDETLNDPLKILQNFRKALLNLNVTQRCQLDLDASRYEKCGKLWKPLTKDGTPSKRFSLVTFRYLYQLWIKSGKQGYLNGQIIKLAINCSSDTSASDESCVLLKLRGTGLKCSATTPTQVTPALPTLGCPTTSFTPLLPPPSVSKSQWSNVNPVTPSKVGPEVNSLVTVSAVRTPFQSSSVAFVFPGSKGERGNEPRDSSLKAVIVGLTAAAGVLLIILVMALAFVYYRRKKRNTSTNSLSSSGLISEKHQQSVSFNPMLDDALYLLPSDMGIQNSELRGTANSRSISNPLYDRGNEMSINLKCEYAHPCKRIPPEPQRNSKSEVAGVKNQGFVPEDNVYSEAWVPATPCGIMSDVSKEYWTSTPQYQVSAASDYKTPGPLYRHETALRPPFYVVPEDNEPYRGEPPGLADEKYEDEMHDETQSPASLYDVVEGIIFEGVDEGIDGERLIIPNPLYEGHKFVQESLDGVERRVNDYQEPLYDIIEQQKTADEVTERFRVAPVYDTAERPIYEPVRSEGPGHHGNASITGSGASLLVDNTKEDSPRRSGENHESPAAYQELLQRGDAAEPGVSYQTSTRPKPKARKTK